MDLNEVHDKLRSETAIPSGFTVTSISPAALQICILAVTDDILRIKANIIVRDDFKVAMSLGDKAGFSVSRHCRRTREAVVTADQPYGECQVLV